MRYVVKDTRTGECIGTSYASRTRATRRADALDLVYGAYRYVVVPRAAPMAAEVR
jgi:hypothetical protein